MKPIYFLVLVMLALSSPVQAADTDLFDERLYVVLGCQHKSNIAKIAAMLEHGQNAERLILSKMAAGECRYVDVGSASTWDDDGTFIRIREGAMTVPYWAKKDGKGVK